MPATPAALTEQQTRHFRDQGYLRLPAPGLSHDLLDDVATLVRARAARLPAGQAKAYRLYQHDPGLMHRLVAHPALTGPLTALLGPNIVYVLNRHNQGSINSPGTQEVRLHRDILQPTRGLLTAVLYIEDATVDTGCTWIVPGSHHAPYVGVPQPDGGGTWLDEHPELVSLGDQAVTAGLTLPWSSGIVGHVNRIEMIKRQTYGRAGFGLLRKRVLLAS